MRSEIIASGLGVFCLTGNSMAQKHEVTKPNIIFIIADDMGYGDLGVLFQNQRAKANDRNNLAGNSGMKHLQQQMKDKELQSRRPNNTAFRPYDQALVPSVQVKNTTAGVQWKAYDGDFPWVPKVASLTPDESGFAVLPEVNVRKTDRNSAIYFEGYIKIPADGEYTFTLTTDNRAVMHIHDAMLIDADYGYFSGSEKNESIKLKAGLHPFRISYLRGTKGKPILNLEWRGPGVDNQPIPRTAFFR